MKKLITVILFCLASMMMVKGQVYDWRGDGRSGIYKETGLHKEWPESGPELLWEDEDLGFGYGSPTITDDAVYITGRVGDDDVLTALTLYGKKKWSVKYGKAWTRNHDGTRCIPTYVEGKIYLVSGSGDIVCVDRNGNIQWSKNHYDIYDSRPLMFGISESPLYVDGKIIASPGGNKASVVAFDAGNGSVIWEAEALNEGPQYVNPLLIERGGKKILVSLTERHIIGINTENGELLWTLDYDKIKNVSGRSSKNHAVTPIYRDGYILVANGYDYPAIKLKLSADGNHVEKVWTNADLEPHHGGMVLIGDYIYSSNHLSNAMGDWVCVDWNTGETMWTERWHCKGPIIYADGMLYLYEERTGHVGLARPNPEKLDIVSEFQITKGTGPHWAHPVIKDGKLYLRHGEVLMVYSIIND